MLNVLFFDALADAQIDLVAQIAVDLNIGRLPGFNQISFRRLYLNWLTLKREKESGKGLKRKSVSLGLVL